MQQSILYKFICVLLVLFLASMSVVVMIENPVFNSYAFAAGDNVLLLALAPLALSALGVMLALYSRRDL